MLVSFNYIRNKYKSNNISFLKKKYCKYRFNNIFLLNFHKGNLIKQKYNGILVKLNKRTFNLNYNIILNKRVKYSLVKYLILGNDKYFLN